MLILFMTGYSMNSLLANIIDASKHKVIDGSVLPDKEDVGKCFIVEIVDVTDKHRTSIIVSGELDCHKDYNTDSNEWYDEYYLRVPNYNINLFFNYQGITQKVYNDTKIIAWACLDN